MIAFRVGPHRAVAVCGFSIFGITLRVTIVLQMSTSCLPTVRYYERRKGPQTVRDVPPSAILRPTQYKTPIRPLKAEITGSSPYALQFLAGPPLVYSRTGTDSNRFLDCIAVRQWDWIKRSAIAPKPAGRPIMAHIGGFWRSCVTALFRLPNKTGNCWSASSGARAHGSSPLCATNFRHCGVW